MPTNTSNITQRVTQAGFSKYGTYETTARMIRTREPAIPFHRRVSKPSPWRDVTVIESSDPSTRPLKRTADEVIVISSGPSVKAKAESTPSKQVMPVNMDSEENTGKRRKTRRPQQDTPPRQRRSTSLLSLDDLQAAMTYLRQHRQPSDDDDDHDFTGNDELDDDGFIDDDEIASDGAASSEYDSDDPPFAPARATGRAPGRVSRRARALARVRAAAQARDRDRLRSRSSTSQSVRQRRPHASSLSSVAESDHLIPTASKSKKEKAKKTKTRVVYKRDGRYGKNFTARTGVIRKCMAHLLTNPMSNYQTQNTAWQCLTFVRHFNRQQEGYIAPWADDDFRTINDPQKQAEVRDAFMNAGCFPAFSEGANIAAGSTHTTKNGVDGTYFR